MIGTINGETDLKCLKLELRRWWKSINLVCAVDPISGFSQIKTSCVVVLHWSYGNLDTF